MKLVLTFMESFLNRVVNLWTRTFFVPFIKAVSLHSRDVGFSGLKRMSFKEHDLGHSTVVVPTLQSLHRLVYFLLFSLKSRTGIRIWDSFVPGKHSNIEAPAAYCPPCTLFSHSVPARPDPWD